MNEDQARVASAYAELAKHPQAQIILDDLTSFAGGLPIEQAAGAWAVIGRLLLRGSALRREAARTPPKSARLR